LCFQVVLEKDGIEVDDNDIFLELPISADGLISLMILHEGEEWMPKRTGMKRHPQNPNSLLPLILLIMLTLQQFKSLSMSKTVLTMHCSKHHTKLSQEQNKISSLKSKAKKQQNWTREKAIFKVFSLYPSFESSVDLGKKGGGESFTLL